MKTAKRIPHNPIQPIIQDDAGTTRFKPNRIVEHLLNFSQKHGCGLNELAVMQFPNDDRQQFAQLIGYSLSGYGELSYVDDDAYGAAAKMAEGKSEQVARIKHLESELKAIRSGLRFPVSRLFGIHPDDLLRNNS